MSAFKYRDLKKKNYFEGWYQRITDEINNVNYSLIFGITKNQEDPHAFIQIYDGVKNKSNYYRFAISDFYYSNDTVFIKENHLSTSSMFLKTNDIEISVLFSNSRYLRKHLGINRAMSYLSMFRFEGYQEFITIDGYFKGELTIDGVLKHINGKTYLEKTYGISFPSRWIWIQGNHFNKDVSLSFAYGLNSLFKWKKKGFMTVLTHNGKEYQFASYNFSKIKILKHSVNQVEIVIKKRKYKLVINVKNIKPVKLVGPSENGAMNLKVYESINSLATLTFTKRKKVIFDTIGRNIRFENMYE